MRYNKDKIIALLMAMALLFGIFTIFVSSNDVPHTNAKAAALYEPKSKTFLYTKNENARLSMASTTKIMTALIALEILDVKEEISVDDRAIGTEGSSIYLEHGEILTAEALIYATMLSSANDAASALAYHISGSIEAFSDLMNEKARKFDLVNTNFANPHGLDSKEHYTSAHDLAIITANAFENPKFVEIVSTKKKTIDSSLKTRVLVNHNKLLQQYDGCIGVKTGYTKKSGRSLVSAAKRNGLLLISVTINDPDDWKDHTLLLDYGYSRLESRKLISQNEFKIKIPVINGETEFVEATNRETLSVICEKKCPQFTREIFLNRYMVAPIKEGDILGKIVFKDKNKIVATTDIIALSDVKFRKKQSIFDFF